MYELVVFGFKSLDLVAKGGSKLVIFLRHGRGDLTAQICHGFLSLDGFSAAERHSDGRCGDVGGEVGEKKLAKGKIALGTAYSAACSYVFDGGFATAADKQTFICVLKRLYRCVVAEKGGECDFGYEQLFGFGFFFGGAQGAYLALKCSAGSAKRVTVAILVSVKKSGFFILAFFAADSNFEIS